MFFTLFLLSLENLLYLYYWLRYLLDNCINIQADSVRDADRLMYFIKRLAHFILLQFADYYTYKLVDLLL